MLEVLIKINRAITKFEEWIAWTSFAFVFALMFVAVIFRYVFNSPFTWTEELILIAFSWIVFLGASACLPAHALLRVDAFVRIAPKPIQDLAGIAAVACMLFILGVFVWYGFAYTFAVWPDEFPMLGLSFGWGFLSLPVASCFAIIHIACLVLTGGVHATFMSVTEMDETQAPGAY
ncbi:TRAP transporter small permease [Xanthobacteraceae bacterium Astr-EGSB]|uniref:TRAP transporter small permease n=1 Tax=Astrobacterium formosum TaxID=3069710 RepID=UPI0027B1DD72|nr:TRAP transporter small permease [Xanthobacteraceae bacterium Astr-EGSB]